MQKKGNIPFLPHSEENPALAPEKIRRQLQRILDSPEFQATNQQQDFLNFVVTETIAGRDHEIKGFTIATRVFGRDEGFDQATDPIVSIQANKLRRALERYYLVSGKQDQVRIDIPKGTYVPTFYKQARIKSDISPQSHKYSDNGLDDSWPLILIPPFKNLTDNEANDYLGVGLVTELATELVRFQEVGVLIPPHRKYEKNALGSVARFVIGGTIIGEKEEIKVIVHLIDTKTGIQIWGDTYRPNLHSFDLIAFQEETARVIAVKTIGEHGIISKSLSSESKNKPPARLTIYEAILRFYEYERNPTPDSFMRALEALEHTNTLEPECGPIWSMLGRLYGNIYGLDILGFKDPLDKAAEFAEKGVLLNPENRRSRCILAYIRMLQNEITSALDEAEKALRLNPNSLCLLDGIGYVMTLAGEWEQGPSLIRKAMQLNPYYLPVAHYALWVDWIRQENYEQANMETLNLKRPAIFWNPLAKAATLGLLGKHEEGKRSVENILKLKPNFQSRGRMLIKRYIKFEDIAERVIEGLDKVGLEIK